MVQTGEQINSDGDGVQRESCVVLCWQNNGTEGELCLCFVMN